MKVSKEIMKGPLPEGAYQGEHTASWRELQQHTTNTQQKENTTAASPTRLPPPPPFQLKIYIFTYALSLVT